MNTEALRRAHAETTPGEWRPMDAPEGNGNFSACLYAEGYGVVGYWRGHKGWHSDANWLLTQDDAHFIALAHKEVPALIDEIERLRELAKANNDLARMETAHRKRIAFQRAELANAMEALTSQYGHRLPADFLLALTQMLMRHGDTARAALGEQS